MKTFTRNKKLARYEFSPTPPPQKLDSVIHKRRTLVSLVLAALLLGALSLFAAASASAQDTTIWSGTLTVKEVTASISGCDTGGSDPSVRCISTSVLTDDDFTYDGVDYEWTLIQNFPSLGFLDLGTAPPISASLRGKATFHVGSSQFALADASVINNNNLLRWTNTGLNWSIGDTVMLRLTVPPHPTVSLSASPNPVTEGEEVTVTATLSRALSSSVDDIPVTVSTASPNTAESDDVGTPTSITINSGATTGTGTITTKLDADNQYETFTVALATTDANWPSGVTAGSPSSVQITINDYKGTLLTVDADPACGTSGTDLSGVEPFPRIRLILDSSVSPSDMKYFPINVQGMDILTDEEKADLPPTVSNFKNAYPVYTSLTSVVQHYRRTYPSFAGFKFSLKVNGTTVTALCTWNFDSMSPPPPTQEPTTNPNPTSDPPTVGPSTGGPSGPPAVSGDEPPPEDEEPSDPDQPDACGENDRENLERFYETTGGEQWDENENWNSDEAPQEWFGVEMDEDGNVVSLRLSENNLSGNMPEELLLCLSELKELALWGNDLSGEVPEELVLAVERAVLRDIAEMLDLNPEWFENYGDPYNFEDWYGGVTTDEEGRVVELDLPGEVPGTLISQLRKLRVITTSSENGGCALSPKDDSSVFSLFLVTLLVFAVLRRKRAR